jgi:hypothetical protein
MYLLHDVMKTTIIGFEDRRASPDRALETLAVRCSGLMATGFVETRQVGTALAEWCLDLRLADKRPG